MHNVILLNLLVKILLFYFYHTLNMKAHEHLGFLQFMTYSPTHTLSTVA